MARVLTQDLTITCTTAQIAAPHGGTASLQGAARLRVDGRRVLTREGVLGATIAMCQSTDASKSQVPCTKVLSTSTATNLRVDGVTVVLEGFTTSTNGSPPGKLAVSGVLHARLRAV